MFAVLSFSHDNMDSLRAEGTILKIETDKKQLWDRLEWARRVSPESTHVVLGTDIEDFIVQIGMPPEFHQAAALADVVEDGAVIIALTDVKEIGLLKGSTITVEATDDSISFTTDEGSVTVPCERTVLRTKPASITRIGKVDIKALRASLPVIKDCVAKKSEKGSEGLLEASMSITADSLTVLATNRLTAWTSSIPLSETSDDESLAGEFVALPWTGALTIVTEPAYLVKTHQCYGIQDENMVSLFATGSPNESERLNVIFAQMREEFAESTPVSFDKARMRSAMESIKKAQMNAKVTFSDNGKTTITAVPIGDEEEKSRAISFSIDYEGESSVESLIISPINLLKMLKGIQGKKFSMYTPADERFPVGIVESDVESVATGSLGLAMTILQPQG